MLLGAMRGWRLSLMLALLLAATTVHAQATQSAATPRAEIDDKEARDLFKLGKQAFDEGRFERALKYFTDAHDLSHRAALLSNIGTVLDRLRRDQEALDAYKSYLAQVPDAPNRAQIEERVRIIDGALHKAAAEQGAASAASATAPEVPTPAQTAQAELARQQLAHETAAPAASAAPAATDGSIVSRWWFWAGLGSVAAAAVIVGVAASSGGGGQATESPALLGSATRVREL
jgi:tetratricopeptide (TPR) repeat protein